MRPENQAHTPTAKKKRKSTRGKSTTLSGTGKKTVNIKIKKNAQAQPSDKHRAKSPSPPKNKKKTIKTLTPPAKNKEQTEKTTVAPSRGRKKTTAKPTQPFREYNIQLEGTQLHVGEWAAGGPVVVCIHGMTANFKSFSLLAEKLQQQGYRILAYDLRGRGRSQKTTGPLSLDIHAYDLLALLDTVGVQKTALLGHSLGAMIALRFAARYPERVSGLVLLDGGARVSVIRRLKSLALVRQSARRLARRFPTPQAYLEQIYASPLLKRRNSRSDEFLLYELEIKDDGSWGTATPPESIEAELNGMGASLSYSKIFLRFLKSPLKFIAQAVKNRPFEPGSIKAPALILRAGNYNLKPNDEFLPLRAAEQLAAELNGAEIHTLKDCNHFEMLFLEDSERDRLITGFLKKINN